MPLDTEKLKTLRLRRKLSTTAAAHEAGFKRAGEWSDIECGRRTNLSIEMLERIANAVGVRAAELLA